MNMLSQCKPHDVFAFFKTICSIPHGSGNVTAIADWCVAFAEDRGLRYIRDDADNVILFKDASKGYEHAEPIVLQGHLDMVCATSQDCSTNLSIQGITPIVEGDWIRAKGTTLGGDNGIAVAMMLAILDDDTLPHPPLEIVLTSDEEVGLLGAHALDASPLRSRKMINLDSEEEGVFTVSCAGGVRAECSLSVQRERQSGIPCTISVGGLTGGHSGVEIHHGRANAHMALTRVLYTLYQKVPFCLLTFSGGEVDNAIAISSSATVLIDSKDMELVSAVTEQYRETLKAEYAVTDPHLTLTLSVDKPITDSAVTRKDTQRIIRSLHNAPNGVQVMSPDIPDLVQTSLNVGIVQLTHDTFTAIFALRSSVEAEKQALCETVQSVFENSGGSVQFSGDYPGWAYRQDSPLRELTLACYRDLFGKEPTVSAIHAGLECGVFADKLNDLDCISFGPDMQDVHTPQERLNHVSCERIYRLVLEILKRSH